VAGDEKPDLLVAITDKDSGDPIDLSASTTTVTAMVRTESNATASLLSITGTKVGTGATGQVTLAWPSTPLLSEGEYELQVIIDYNGSTQTIYDIIRIHSREDFPAVA